jgi:hypothetical protein
MKRINRIGATDPSGPVRATRQRRNGRMRLLACWPVAAALLTAASIAGCGGSSPGNGGNVAHIDTSTASSTSTNSTITGWSSSGCSSPSASASLEAKALNYAACMRSHGLTNFPDPTIGPNGLPNFTINGSPKNSDLDPNSPQLQSAQKACKSDVPNLGQPTPAEKTVANAKALEYAECMRSNGEPEFPDPNGEGVIKITNATGILESDSPQYLKAAKACQSLDSGFTEQSSQARSGGSL